MAFILGSNKVAGCSIVCEGTLPNLPFNRFMLSRPNKNSYKDLLPKDSQSNPSQQYQHGHENVSSLLLDIPPESLTYITSLLDPPTLLLLSTVNQRLYAHVKDDNTWRRAFVYQFLKIGPEIDVSLESSLMLRHIETSWRNEYISRYKLRRRWERSRNTTITHTPHHSPISEMHMMPFNSLLTSSLQYGIVSRSIPLTGKVLRGYLNASGTGLGIGNPNAEFTPNVSACSLFSDGGTAKIAWAYRNGEVAIMTASKAMEIGAGTAAKMVRCKVHEEHAGSVLDIIWDKDTSGDSGKVITGGSDGRAKIWDAKLVSCLWTSEPVVNLLTPDSCVKVAATLSRGIVVGGMRSGDVQIWANVLTSSPLADAFPDLVIKSPSPFGTIARDPFNEGHSISHDIVTLCLDHTQSSTAVLVSYENHPLFYRVDVNLTSMTAKQVAFGDPSFGNISCIQPVFATRGNGCSFVLVGDLLGCVNLYDWNRTCTVVEPGTEHSKNIVPSVRASRKFEAHGYSAVTALAWSSVTLLTGSSNGLIKVFDSLTFEPLRSFGTAVAPPPRIRAMVEGAVGEEEKVNQILLGPDKDFMVASVGPQVVSFWAAPIRKEKYKAQLKNTSTTKNSRGIKGSKYHQQLELYQAIAESKQILKEEHMYKQRIYGREREQRDGLDMLGLDEVEAVEYLLMVSRDEEERRLRASGSQSHMEEGIFEGDFDEEVSGQIASSTSQQMWPSTSWSSRRSSGSSNRSPQKSGISTPRISPSNSNKKVQVSPRFRPEPMEAGPTASTSPLNIAGPEGAPSSISPKDTVPYQGISPNSGSGSDSMRRTQSSGVGLNQPKSAWAVPLRSAASSSSSSSPRRSMSTHGLGGGPSPPSLVSSAPAVQGTAVDGANPPGRTRDVEELNDLRFVIELSLAEARSMGENV